MGIDWFRDLFIIIFGLVGTVALIFISILAYKVYRRTKSILDAAKATSGTIRGISSYVGDEVVKPMVQVVALIQGVRQGIDAVSRFFKKQEGGKDG